MSAYSNMMDFKRFLEDRVANNLPIYEKKPDGTYGYHPDVEAEFQRICGNMNSEYAPMKKYSVSQVKTLREHVKYLLTYGFKESVVGRSLTGTEKAEMAKLRRDQQALLIRYFGSVDIDSLSDQDFITIYEKMTYEMGNYSKLNSVLIDKAKGQPAYKEEQAEKNKKNIFQKIAANKVFKAVIGNRIKALFTSKDCLLVQQAKGLKPIDKAIRLENINKLIAAFENLSPVGPQTIQANPGATAVVGGSAPIVGSSSGPPITDSVSDDTSAEVVDEEEPIAAEPVVEETITATDEPIVAEPPKTTKVRKTVRQVKPVTTEEIAEHPEKFAKTKEYPTMTHIDDSGRRTPKVGWNSVGQIAVGSDAKGNPIVATVYQNPNRPGELYYGNPRVNAKVKTHDYVRDQLKAGQDFGEIKVGDKEGIPFRFKINEDGSLYFVSSELVADVESGNVTRSVEEYVDEQIEVEVPFDGDAKETQEAGAPVALVESGDSFNPPSGVETKTTQVRVGDDQIYGEVKTYEYYEDPHNKGTFLVREVVGDYTVPGTAVSEEAWGKMPTRLEVHSDAYDQDFNFELGSGSGMLTNVDHIVEQERIDADRARNEELERQQAEELRIQKEQAEIDKKKDYIHNGPNPELYELGDKKYPTFEHPERQDQLHGYEKLSVVIPVGTYDVTMPDGSVKQRVKAVEVWRSKSDPTKFYIGDEVETHRSPEDFKEELSWTDGHSPVIDIANHKGFKDNPSVDVVISRDENGKLTIVSADFVKDYEAGNIKNKFSERVSGTPEPPKPDVTVEMPDEYIYARLHQDEYIKYCKKQKIDVGELDSMDKFYETKGRPKQQVESFRRLANNESQVDEVINGSKITSKQYLKLKKDHPQWTEEETRIQFMLDYRGEMIRYNESGKLDKFFKKYKIKPTTMDDTNGTIVGGLNPESMGKDSIVAEYVLTEDELKDTNLDLSGYMGEDVIYVDRAAEPPKKTGPQMINADASTFNPPEGVEVKTTYRKTPGDSYGLSKYSYYEDPSNPGTFIVKNDGNLFAPDYEAEYGKASSGVLVLRSDKTNEDITFDPSTGEMIKREPVVAPTATSEEAVAYEYMMGGINSAWTYGEDGITVQYTPGETVVTPSEGGLPPEKPTAPETPVEEGLKELPLGIEDMAADCLWKDILTEVGGLKKAHGSPYIGSKTLEILKLAAGDPSVKPEDVDKKMDEIILTTYENAHLRDLLQSKGLSKLPEGQEGLDIQAEARRRAQADYDSIPWEEISLKGKARLTLQELSKARFNPNNGRELEDGKIPDDHRRDSFFYRGLCKAGINFNLGQYRDEVRRRLDSQLDKGFLTEASNIDKFKPVKVIGDDGKEINAHLITINGIDVYLTEDHQHILEVSDLSAAKEAGKFGDIDMSEVIKEVGRDRPRGELRREESRWQDGR